MNFPTAEVFAQIFSDIELIHSRGKAARRDLLLHKIEQADSPGVDKPFLRDFLQHYVDLRTKLKANLRSRPHEKILSEQFDIDLTAASSLLPEVTISAGVLSYNIFITEKGIEILNEAIEQSKGVDETKEVFFDQQTAGTASHAPDIYPMSLIAISRTNQPCTEEKLLAAILKTNEGLTQTESHENMHHLHSLIMQMQGKDKRPFRAIMSRHARIKKFLGLKAPDIIMRNENRALLELVQVVRPDISSLENLSTNDWEEIASRSMQEATDHIYVDTRSEILARLHARQHFDIDRAIHCSYLPEWTKNIPDFNETKWWEVTLSALNSVNFITTGDAGISHQVVVMMLLDVDLREWSTFAHDFMLPRITQ